MRLLDYGDRHDYKPLDRGTAFIQYYEDGDKYEIFDNMIWNYYFWHEGVWHLEIRHNEFDPTWTMGSEL